MKKTYSECVSFPTFKERYKYLATHSKVGESTFGGWAYLRTRVYTGSRWIRLKNKLIIRDKGCDLACEGHPIDGIDADGREIKMPIVIHHINPITKDDIIYGRECVYDPENLIICTEETHRAIHYGDYSLIDDSIIERRPNDTIPWKR